MKTKFWLNISIIFTMLFFTVMSMSTFTAAAQEDSPMEYELYPLPQDITYHEGLLQLDKAIQVIYDNTIDSVTRKKAETIFTENGYSTPTFGTEPADDKINILVGTKGSNGPVDSYAAANVNSKSSDFSKIDAYQLDIQENTITILGKDTDASFLWW